tara:strand:+ start:631 stop:1047 length:417 start_codon:yes stop_codon:yes gene_type:complete
LNSKISDKDKKDWDEFLASNEKLSNKDLDHSKKKIKKFFTFDLHGYSLDEANKKVKNLISEAYNNYVTKLIIVTGKGLHSQNDNDPYVSRNYGILKHSVPEYIKNNDEIMTMIDRVEDASIEDGGSGAFYIYLRKKKL